MRIPITGEIGNINLILLPIEPLSTLRSLNLLREIAILASSFVASVANLVVILPNLIEAVFQNYR